MRRMPVRHESIRPDGPLDQRGDVSRAGGAQVVVVHIERPAVRHRAAAPGGAEHVVRIEHIDAVQRVEPCEKREHVLLTFIEIPARSQKSAGFP